MRIAGALMYASFVFAVFASVADRATPLWLILAIAVVVLFLAALVRVHAVINSPKADR